jgi:hypothetical protein
MGYAGIGTGTGGGDYELLHANEGVLRIDQMSYSDEIESIVLPADLTALDRLEIMLRVWQIGGTAGSDFAEFYPWFGSDTGSSGFLWPNCDTSALHYMGYRIDTTRGSGLVCAMDQRNGGSDPSFWTSNDSSFADVAALASQPLGLSVMGYLRSAGYFDWGWAWTVHRIRAN